MIWENRLNPTKMPCEICLKWPSKIPSGPTITNNNYKIQTKKIKNKQKLKNEVTEKWTKESEKIQEESKLEEGSEEEFPIIKILPWGQAEVGSPEYV